MATFRSLAAADATSDDLPLRWVWIGGGLSALLVIAVQWLFFGTPVWHSVLAILLALPLGLVALRVLGETNWGPISTMTNVMQAMFAGHRARRPARQHGVERHHRRGGRGVGRADAGLPGRSDDRIDAAHPHLHAAHRRAGRRAGAGVHVSTAARHLRHHRRARAAAQPDVAAMGRIREARDAGSLRQQSDAPRRRRGCRGCRRPRRLAR